VANQVPGCIFKVGRGDLLPWIRTYASMISDLGEEKHEQEQAQ